jgi:transcriptional regulator with XRE-family HTH domain
MTGQEIVRIRRSAGLSRRELALRSHLSESTIQRIEKDLAIPRHATQHLLLRTLLGMPRKIEDELENQAVIYEVNPQAMAYYTGKALGWRHWPGWRRAQWTRWRIFYSRIRLEADSGRALLKFRQRDDNGRVRRAGYNALP